MFLCIITYLVRCSVYDGLGFQSVSLSTVTKLSKETGSCKNTKPQAGINIVVLAVVYFSFQSADGCLSLAPRLLFVIPVIISKNKRTKKLTKKVISWLSDPTNSVRG